MYASTFTQIDSSQINLNAGSELMDYFQRKWISLHEQTELNLNKAQAVKEGIDQLDDYNNKLCHSMQTLVDQVSTFDNVLLEIDLIEKEMVKTCSLLSKMENAITDLSKLSIQQEFEQKRKSQLEHLEQLIHGHNDELRLYEQGLKEAVTLKQIEQRKKEEQILRERQSVFQSAFEEEIKLFKEKGHLPSKSDGKDLSTNSQSRNDSEPSSSETLENISLEIDPNDVDEFEQFLKDS